MASKKLPITYTKVSRKPLGRAKGTEVEKWFTAGKLTSRVDTRWTKNYQPSSGN